MSSPRFSKQNTCSMPGLLVRSAVRCRQASTTRRAWGRVSSANEVRWLLENEITSQRPCPGALTKSSTPASGRLNARPSAPERLGKRFSKTTTS
jgi:hypothetical protein